MRQLYFLFILSCICHVSLSQSSEHWFTIEPGVRGAENLHRVKPQIIYEDKTGEQYVRCFQAIVKPVEFDSSRPRSILSNKYKDIVQDSKGYIIFKPAGLSQSGPEPLWLGIGDPRHQIDFLRKYLKLKDSNPMIRSFLLPLDVVQKLMTERMTTEAYSKRFNLDVNVDLSRAPNQFGFKGISTETIIQNALRGSLVTIVEKKKREEYPDRLGTIISLETAENTFEMYASKLPIDPDHLQVKTLKAVLPALKEIERNAQSSSFTQDQLKNFVNHFNEKYCQENNMPNVQIVQSIEKSDLRNLEHIIKEVETRINLADRYTLSLASERSTVKKLEHEDWTFKYSEGQKQLEFRNTDVAARHKQRQEDVKIIHKAEAAAKLILKHPVLKKSLKIYSFSQLTGLKQEEIYNFQIGFIDDKLRNKLEILDQKLEETVYKEISIVESEKVSLLPSSGSQTYDTTAKQVEIRDDFLVDKNSNKIIILCATSDTEIILKHDSKTLEQLPRVIENSVAFNSKVSDTIKLTVYYDVALNSYDRRVKEVLHLAVNTDHVHTVYMRSPSEDYLRYDVIGNWMFANCDDIGTPRLLKHIQSPQQVNIITPTATDLHYVPDRDTVTDSAYKKAREASIEYDREIICQMDSSKEVVQASEYLNGKHKSKKGKRVLHLSYEEKSLRYASGNQGSNMKFVVNERTRITIVGHGENSGSGLKVGGQDAATLASAIKKYLPANVAKITVGKINVVACNIDPRLGAAIERGIQFGQDLLNKFQSDEFAINIIAVRVGEVQVDDEGRKQYSMNSREVQMKYAENPPLLVQIDKDEKMSFYHRAENRWGTELPKDKPVQKVYVVSTAAGILSVDEDFSPSHRQLRPQASGILDYPKPITDNAEFLTTNFIPVPGQSYFVNMDDPAWETQRLFAVRDSAGAFESISQLEGSVWLRHLDEAIDQARLNLPNKSDWVPIIATAERISPEESQVRMVNSKTGDQELVHLNTDTFVEFKAKASDYHVGEKSLPSYSMGSVAKTGIGSLISAMSFIQAALNMDKLLKCRADKNCTGDDGSALATALKVHSYLSVADGAIGTVGNVMQIGELVVGFRYGRKAIEGVATIPKGVHGFLKASNMLGKVTMVTGIGMGVFGLGLSAPELHRAKTFEQKFQAGVAVAADSLNLVSSGVEIGSQILAATIASSSSTMSAIASAAGPVGFVVGVVGFLTTTITHYSFEFIETRERAGQVGKYFFNLDKVYRSGGVEYDQDSQTLSVRQHAIVELVDLIDGRVVLDSQFIYRTRHGKTGSGKINYFFLHKDFPKMDNDKSQAINIREGIGYPETYPLGHKNVTTIVLPNIPKSYISYSYSRLPFCTSMRDEGFDIIRKLENDSRFDYDFYIIPGEQIVSQISHEYVQTEFTARINRSVKTIFIPERPEEIPIAKHYHYTLKTIGSEHAVIIRDGVNVTLENTSIKPCTWYLYAFNHSRQITFNSSRTAIEIGTAVISFMTRSDCVIVIDTSIGSVTNVNLTNGKMQIMFVDKPRNMTDENFETYFKNIDKNLYLGQDFIVISDYTKLGIDYGTAYYDLKLQRFLYSNFEDAAVSWNFKDRTEILGIVENTVFFMSEENNGRQVIWNCDPNNHTIIASFSLFCGNEDYRVTRLNVHEGALFVIQIVRNVSLIYMIRSSELVLMSIDGTKESVYKLSEDCFPTLLDFLPGEFLPLRERKPRFPGRCVYARTAPLLPLKQTTSDGFTQHFWFYMNDTYDAREIQEEHDIFCPSSLPPHATGIIKPNMTTECDDLTLRDVKLFQNTTGVYSTYFFYCERNNSLFYQLNDTAAVEIDVPDGISRVEDYRPTKFIRSKSDALYKFTETGQLSLVAVSFNFVSRFRSWKHAVYNLSNTTLMETHIVLSDMKNVDGKNMTAWYDSVNDVAIILSPALDAQAQHITYIGPTPSTYIVWLYDNDKGSLILQQVLTDEEVANMTQFRPKDGGIWLSSVLPVGNVVVSNLAFAKFADGNTVCMDKNGVIFSVDYFAGKHLLGVSNIWLSTHASSLSKNLEMLCKQYNATGIIEMLYNTTSDNERCFYHCSWDSVVRFALSNGSIPQYLGQNELLKSLYFATDEGIIEYQTDSTKPRQLKRATDQQYTGVSKLLKCSYAKVNGGTFVLQTSAFEYTVDIPLLDDIVSLIVGVTDNARVFIKADVWLYYKTIMITSIGSDGAQKSRITIETPFSSDCRLSTTEGESVIHGS